MKPASQLLGRRFGRLTVGSRVWPNVNGNTIWSCLCDCGATSTVSAIQLTSGRTQSCGCLRMDRLLAKIKTHGQSRTQLHRIWGGMLKRCRNKDDPRYGGRGIFVCERWHSYENFMADMGKPKKGETLERRDNDGPYSPDNCRWASRKEQGRNTSTTIIVEFGGERMSLSEACERAGLKHHPVYMRMRRGMPFASAISVNVERIRA